MPVDHHDVVEMIGISKSYGGVKALDNVQFSVRSGEVHALVGENGAGKSTLMKVLQGVVRPDAGTIRINGSNAIIANPLAARQAGVGMVFQEFSLIPTMTVAENISLCDEPRRSFGRVDKVAEEAKAHAILRDMGVEIDPRAPLAELGTAWWQLTEIAKALAQQARVLILDEPTASLARHETEALFALIGRLKARGLAIIYISHRMDEIYRIADRITVLRDARWVLTKRLSELTPAQIVEAIAGREVTEAIAWRAPERAPGAALIEVDGLMAGPWLRGVSFTLRAGEVLGIAGLMGSGRTELVTALFGVLPIESGVVRIDGREVRITRPQDAIRHGLALIPEDRRLQGLVLEHSVAENITLPVLARVTRAGVLVSRRIAAVVAELISRLEVKVADAGAPVQRLSGGNQQKVVIAKWLGTNPRVLMMDEPTAGVDVGTKAEIVAMIRRMAADDKGVILISSELSELLAVSDRILVLRRGRVGREMPRADVTSEDFLQLAIQEDLPVPA
jgi:ribose transport system ATP-binding protein